MNTRREFLRRGALWALGASVVGAVVRFMRPEAVPGVSADEMAEARALARKYGSLSVRHQTARTQDTEGREVWFAVGSDDDANDRSRRAIQHDGVFRRKSNGGTFNGKASRPEGFESMRMWMLLERAGDL
jgi:hypothetical protein